MIVILGPTATGKTHFGAFLADKINAEIISADSRQVYKRMTVGTGKDYDDYIVDGHKVPFHLIDIVEPGYEYNIFEYKRDFMLAYDDIIARGKNVVLCGGSGMYLEAVMSKYQLNEVPINKKLREQFKSLSDSELSNYLYTIKRVSNKELHNHTDLDTRERMIRAIEIERFEMEHVDNSDERQVKPELIIGLNGDRDVIREKIKVRLRHRLDNENMVKEVEELIDSGVDSERLKRYGLEYKFITMYLLGEISFEQMFDKLFIAICQFSKRQMTWFRRMERHGYDIKWVDAGMNDEKKLSFLRDNDILI